MLPRKKFCEYYKKNPPKLPLSYSEREWAFVSFDGIMKRHLAFKKASYFLNFLKKECPRDLYYSTAFYKYPDAQKMEDKFWNGAELVFDLDADHIKTRCKEKHDYFECKCGYMSRKKEICKRCGGKMIEKKWLCEECMEKVKNETINLVNEFLIGDFGFSDEDININFSGQRGYHVHVLNPNIFHIGQRERREIVEYIMGEGLELQSILKSKRNLNTSTKRGKEILIGPKPSDAGWYGRIAEGMIEFLEDPEKFNIDLDDKTLKRINEYRDELITGIKKGYWQIMIDTKVFDYLKSIVSVNLGSEIDQLVTTDIKRLIRLPESLHGKTGLLAKKLSLEELPDFDPFSNAVVFDDKPIKVWIRRAPEFNLKEESFGPFEEEEAVLPSYAAIFLICRGDARINEKNGNN
ncbi:MAG: DNA primase small subunit domain-containing protein [Candidatus Hydrothermarchaeota archaeon]